MTRDEQRAACIEAMAEALWHTKHGYDGGRAQAAAAFDALHGIARVSEYTGITLRGDLTNPPEKKT